jgi:hypothetical protein
MSDTVGNGQMKSMDGLFKMIEQHCHERGILSEDTPPEIVDELRRAVTELYEYWLAARRSPPINPACIVDGGDRRH